MVRLGSFPYLLSEDCITCILGRIERLQLQAEVPG
jgi:hypothetical protein